MRKNCKICGREFVCRNTLGQFCHICRHEKHLQQKHDRYYAKKYGLDKKTSGIL